MSRFVTIVGSLHYDLMIEGAHLPRLGETAVGRSWHPKLGGKGRNQAVAAAMAGANTRIIGCVGTDDFGQALIEDLDRNGVDRAGVLAVDAATGMSVAISEPDGDYGAVIVSSANLALTAGRIRERRELFEYAGVLVLQNEISEEANLAAGEIVHSRGGYVILNAAPARPAAPKLVENVDLLVVNEIEAAQMSSVDYDGRAARLDAAGRLAEDWKQVAVTAGSRGVILAARGHQPLEMPAEIVRVRSTHGAGDCFVGTLAALVAQGASTTDALGGAVRAAGRFVAGL